MIRERDEAETRHVRVLLQNTLSLHADRLRDVVLYLNVSRKNPHVRRRIRNNNNTNLNMNKVCTGCMVYSRTVSEAHRRRYAFLRALALSMRISSSRGVTAN